MFLYLNICLFPLPTIARIIFHLETLETKLNSEHHRTKKLNSNIAYSGNKNQV